MTLLTTQLLSAPSIWRHSQGTATPFRILGVFNIATREVLRREDPTSALSWAPTTINIRAEDWLLAVVKGADEKSPRWRHLCVFAGLRAGIEACRKGQISSSVQRLIESAISTAANGALSDLEDRDGSAASAIVLSLSYIFNFLDDRQRNGLDYDLLLPVLLRVCFSSKDGLHSGYFLSNIDADLLQKDAAKFEWSPKSPTFLNFKQISQSPIINAFGALSRLMAHAIEHVRKPNVLAEAVTELGSFSRCFCVQWRQNKLSEIDVSEEQTYLEETTLRETLPLLWRVLRSSMFSIVIVLRSLLGKMMVDGGVPQDMGKQQRKKPCAHHADMS